MQLLACIALFSWCSRFHRLVFSSVIYSGFILAPVQTNKTKRNILSAHTLYLKDVKLRWHPMQQQQSMNDKYAKLVDCGGCKSFSAKRAN